MSLSSMLQRPMGARRQTNIHALPAAPDGRSVPCPPPSMNAANGFDTASCKKLMSFPSQPQCPMSNELTSVLQCSGENSFRDHAHMLNGSCVSQL